MWEPEISHNDTLLGNNENKTKHREKEKLLKEKEVVSAIKNY
jgi:hypothetical protein